MDLKELSTTRSVLLIARGHSFKDARQAKQRFHEAIEAVRKKVGKKEELSFFVIDDSSSKPLSETLLTRLGIYHDKPFVLILDRFLKTERKFVSPQASIPTAKEMEELVMGFLKGELKPTIMGQPRPDGDRSAYCLSLVELVTSSFDELVLADPTTDVLVEGYTSKCDACKAFGPRIRMLAALAEKHYGSKKREGGKLRIACFNILDNDRPVEHMPEKWTPSLRLFLANPDVESTGSGKPSKKSVLFRYGKKDEDNDGSNKPAEAAAKTKSDESDNSVPAEEKVKVTIPSILDLLSFIEKATGGRIKVTEAVAKEAEALEEEAVILERCYDQCLEFMELWAAYSEAIKSKPVPDKRAAEQATAKRLQQVIIAAYRFLLNDAKAGSAEEAIERLQAVSSFIAENKIGERIEAAYADE